MSSCSDFHGADDSGHRQDDQREHVPSATTPGTLLGHRCHRVAFAVVAALGGVSPGHSPYHACPVRRMIGLQTEDFDPEEDEPVLEPSWPHLQVTTRMLSCVVCRWCVGYCRAPIPLCSVCLHRRDFLSSRVGSGPLGLGRAGGVRVLPSVYRFGGGEGKGMARWRRLIGPQNERLCRGTSSPVLSCWLALCLARPRRKASTKFFAQR